MLARDKPDAYVDPFDRICHGLRGETPPQLQTRKKFGVSLADLNKTNGGSPEASNLGDEAASHAWKERSKPT